MSAAKRLSLGGRTARPRCVTFGVCATSDPRIDPESRQRCVNIVELVAEGVAEAVRMPDGTAASVVWSPVPIDGEKQADIVARQFQKAGVDAHECRNLALRETQFKASLSEVFAESARSLRFFRTARISAI